jgi:hypothetical protein
MRPTAVSISAVNGSGRAEDCGRVEDYARVEEAQVGTTVEGSTSGPRTLTIPTVVSQHVTARDTAPS